MLRLANATKYLIILSPLLLLPLFLQLSTTAPRNVIGGDFISLTKELSNDAVQKSGVQNEFKKIKKEKLDRTWACISELPSGVRIWKNYARFFILVDEDSTAGIQVFKGDVNLPQRKLSFEPDTPAGFWDSYDNQVFLSTRKNENPNHDSYYVDYSTFAGVETEIVKQEVLNRQLPYLKGVAFPLSYPLWIGSGSDLSFFQNGKEIPFNPGLLTNDLSPKSKEFGWNYLDDLQTTLHDSGVLRITSEQPEYSFKKYVGSGIAALVIQAKADFKEHKMPALLMYQDNHLVDRVEIVTDGYAQYSTKLFVVPSGERQIRLALEETVKNRNVSILELSLHYSSAIVVNGAANSASFTVDYPTKCSFLSRASFYRKFSAIAGDKLTWDVHHGREVRKALVLTPNSKITYPLKIPAKGSLRFGYGFEVPAGCAGNRNGSANGRLAITIKEPFQTSRTIFSRNLEPSEESGFEDWSDESISLEEFGGKPVELTIETTPGPKEKDSQLLTFLSEPVVASESPAASDPPEQIIVISADALRADHLGSYGYERQTSPNLDAFAKDGVLFENAVSQSSWTLPSFSSLFTSVYPSFHRAYSFDVRPLTSELSLIPEIQDQGYATAAFVNNPCLYPLQGFSQGFDRYDYGVRSEQDRIEHALEWIQRMKNRRFFLMLHLMKPHEPYAAPPPYSSAYMPVSPRKLDTSTRSLDEIDSSCKKLPDEDLRYLIAQYDGEVLYLDHLLSRFFNRLKQLDVYDNALIVFLSDHGEEFREHQRLLHGTSVYQEQIHIPLIMKFPQNYSRKNIRIPRYVETIDVLPTVLDVIRADAPKYVQGKSLLPLIGRGTSSGKEDLLLSETQIAGKAAMVQGHYKYVFTTNAKDFEASAVPCSVRKKEELYDLQADPRERKDILAQHPEIADHFRKQRLEYENKVSEFLKKRGPAVSSTPYILDETVKEELRALGYIN